MRIPLLAALLGIALPTLAIAANADSREPLHMAVMDPLYKKLACDCIKGFAQRDYDAMADSLSKRLGRPIAVVPCESLAAAKKLTSDHIELIVGKQSVIKAQATALSTPLRPLAMLTGTDGKTTLTGLFIVRTDDPAKTIADLKGRKVLFGLPDADEKYAAALATMKSLGLPVPAEPETRPACNHAAVDVSNKTADAAVISSYAIRLAEGCGAVEKGSLRIVGETAPVPFITVFATDKLPATEDAAVISALLEVSKDAALKVKMESRDGFVPMPGSAAWSDWRGGPLRDAMSNAVPERLPAKPRFAWRKKMSGPAMAGVAVSLPYVIVADKSADGKADIWRCLDAQTGSELWKLEYAAPGDLDYTNTARATPVICADKVYLLGAFGRLECLELKSGKRLWGRDLLADFGGKPLSWGFCASPLIDGDRLIVGTASQQAALVALNRLTGEVLWKTPGNPTAYAGMLAGDFGGHHQIVGYDAASLGGWNPENGKRLWTLNPKEPRDFNVPTPLNLGGRLLVATENNGTRLYGFNADGTIAVEPIASNGELSPDVSTPVSVNGLLFGVAKGAIYCLDVQKKLATCWTGINNVGDYASLIGGNGRVLAISVKGELMLLNATSESCPKPAALQIFEETSPEVWSHPALVGDRLYLRSQSETVCLILGDL